MMTEELLRSSLEVSVPMYTEKLKRIPMWRIQQLAGELGTTLASTADVVLYRSKKPGETAKAFNTLAEGLAVLSFLKGGVRVFGLHFEATHPDMVQNTSDNDQGDRR